MTIRLTGSRDGAHKRAETYRIQMEYYARGLEAILQVPLRKIFIFFKLRRDGAYVERFCAPYIMNWRNFVKGLILSITAGQGITRRQRF